MSENKEKRPFGFKDKIGYMFGDFGNDFSFLFASNYLMVFYTKVLGLSGFVVGLLFMGTRIVDAFTDVTMGRIVDHIQPAKDGRFRPWIRRMCIPVAVASHSDLSAVEQLLLYRNQHSLWFHGICHQSGCQGQGIALDLPGSRGQSGGTGDRCACAAGNL